jgi:glycosyltransferase involved in cell wall biosynthesis
MKISFDGGGLPRSNGRAYGVSIFSENLLKALATYDKKNIYFVYTLFKDQKILEKSYVHFQTLTPRFRWMNVRVPVEELIVPKNVYLGPNQAVPSYVSGKIISFSQGLSFYFFKDMYKKEYPRLKKQLDDYMKRSHYIIASSKRVAHELKQLDPSISKQVVVLPFCIPYDMEKYTERNREPYLLFVGNNMQIKNVPFIVNAFKKLIKEKGYEHLKLYLVGPFEEYMRDSDIKVFSPIKRTDLRELYRKASVYVTASFYESFNYPVLEALCQRCPVVGLRSAIVPELEEFVYATMNEKEFIAAIKKVLAGDVVKYNRRRLESVFSWEKYVKKLTELY